MKTLLLFLHGSGGNGPELVDYLNQPNLHINNQYTSFMNQVSLLDIDVYCPTSRYIPYTPIGGCHLTAWFDRSEDFINRGFYDPFEDVNGIDESINDVIKFIHIQEETKSILYDNIIIGGFSMGGGLSLQFSSPIPSSISDRLRGIFVCSSYAVHSSRIFNSIVSNSRLSQIKLPILMLHGKRDRLISIEWGRLTYERLAEFGQELFDLNFKEYNHVDHELDPSMLIDIISWLHGLNIHKNDSRVRDATSQAYSHINQLPFTLQPVDSESHIYHVSFKLPDARITMDL